MCKMEAILFIDPGSGLQLRAENITTHTKKARAQIPFFSSGIQPTAMELATMKERTIDTETDLHTQ